MLELYLQKHLHTSEGDQLLEVALSVPKGTLLALYGKSGVGKTTILRMLAGLTLPDAGFIRVQGQCWFDAVQRTHLSPQKRMVGVLFQDYALFPNMTVRQNLEYALPNPKDKSWVTELLQLTGLTELASRLPTTLSGGQQQRVALSRALARKPDLLLLDEPFSSVDTPTRTRLQAEIVRLHKHFGLTTVLVSHDAEEIRTMADYVVELNQGRIIGQGTPAEVFGQKEASNVRMWTGTIESIEQTATGWKIRLGDTDVLQEIVLSGHETGIEWKIGDILSVSYPYRGE